MLKILPPLLVIVSLAVSPVLASSASQQPVGQSNLSKAPNLNDQGTANQRGTEQAPFVIEIRNAKQPEHHTAAAQQQNKYGWFEGWSIGDKIALVVAVIAFLQFGALIGTYRVMDQTAKRQLRAYVSVEDIDLDSPNIGNANYDTPIPNPPGYIPADAVRMTVKNNGQTPAHDVAVFLNWHPIEPFGQIPLGSALPNYITEENILNSSRQILDAQRKFSHTIWIYASLAVFRQAMANQARLIFYGWIEYTDIFGVKWVRNFRFVWQPNRTGDDRLYPSREGNLEHRANPNWFGRFMKR